MPVDRFAAVVDAAARVFITHGYQRAQIQDVANALRLGKGTLYGYAQGKAALFAAAVRYADGIEALPTPAQLPVAAPAGRSPPTRSPVSWPASSPTCTGGCPATA